MILEITIAGEINYIDTDIILYAYDDSGLKIVVASEGVRNNPTLEIFTNANAQTVTLPTYANFVLATAGARFIEMSSVMWGNICVNIDRIAKLAEIDASNTTVLFDKYNVVDTDTAMATLITAINDASGSVIPIPPITGSTKTKITYNSAGQVTAGADATTADIADSTNRRYVTDAQQTVIGNTSGTNSGDNATNTQYSGLAASKQDTLVSGTNIKTVNSNSLVGAGNVVIAETVNTIGALVNGAASATPNDTDLVMSVESSVAKKNTWTQIKAFLKTHFDTFYATIANLNLKAPLASPTFTGNVAAPNLNTGTTLNGTVFAKSTTAVSLASTAHAATFGNEATGVNMAVGLYSTGAGVQARNNGVISVLFLNPLGGDTRVGAAAPAGASNLTLFHTGSGTGDYAEISARNGAGAAADGLLLRTFGTAWTTSGSNFQDGSAVMTGTNLSGGLSIGTQASADARFYSNNTLRFTISSSGHTHFTNRLEETQATVASANNLTLTTANHFIISGTTTINAITTTDWQAGAVISLQFQGILTVKNNTAGGAGTQPMRLAGAVDFVTSALDTLTLKYDGTQWVELGRSNN